MMDYPKTISPFVIYQAIIDCLNTAQPYMLRRRARQTGGPMTRMLKGIITSLGRLASAWDKGHPNT